MSVWFDVHREGPAVALVHAGVADSRMWEPSRSCGHAERVTIPGAAHLPSLERPAEFDRIVPGFLAEHGV